MTNSGATDAAGKVFEGAKAGAWDVGFIAIEPVRAAEIEFTAPYVVIDGKASGFVADALTRSGQVANVAPPAK